MRIAHLSDIHWCDKHLAEVQRVTAFAAEDLMQRRADLIVLSGDLFDHRLEQNSPALLGAQSWVYQLAGIAPVLILQGTFSHDAPRALDTFRFIRSIHDVVVADKITQWVLTRDDLLLPMTGEFLPGDKALISCLPAVNKGAVAAAVGAENAGHAVGEFVAALLQSWAPLNEKARNLGIATIAVSHGTVSGCLTEHGVPMAGLDHEYTTGTLFAAGANAVMVGHIHKMQVWQRQGQAIAYPGSLGRLHFGEVDPKGYLMWTFGGDDGVDLEFIETPAKRLIEIEYPGAPDMSDLVLKAVNLEGAHVRIRYTIDEEHRSSVDKARINSLFSEAAEVKIEARINPVQRQRAAGIVKAVSVSERLAAWCEYTASESTPLLERLGLLESMDAEVIAKELLP